ncbi:MAG: hypothetical protein IJ342_04550 [Muribaculaceae bacterium]|nr:hypothetical protein [Muribaculaceae bacterium]
MNEQLDIYDEIIKLLNSGNYEITQKVGDKPEEPYVGCMTGIYMCLGNYNERIIVEELDANHILSHKEYKTYCISFDGVDGKTYILIRETSKNHQ